MTRKTARSSRPSLGRRDHASTPMGNATGPSDEADQCIRLGVADDRRVVRGAEPDARRRLDPVAPVVTGNQKRPEERDPVGGVGFLQVSETKLGGIHTPQVRRARELINAVVRLLRPGLVGNQGDDVGLRLKIDFQPPVSGAFSEFECPMSFPIGWSCPLPVPVAGEETACRRVLTGTWLQARIRCLSSAKANLPCSGDPLWRWDNRSHRCRLRPRIGRCRR